MSNRDSENQSWETLVYSGIAVGVLAGVAASTYIWRQRVRAMELLNVSPVDRAEQLISSCEDKLDSIERSMSELKAAH